MFVGVVALRGVDKEMPQLPQTRTDYVVGVVALCGVDKEMPQFPQTRTLTIFGSCGTPWC